MGSARDAVSVDKRDHSFRADLRDEFVRVFRFPWEDLVAVAVNAGLVVGLWFLLPQAVKDWLFIPQGPAAFAVVLGRQAEPQQHDRPPESPGQQHLQSNGGPVREPNDHVAAMFLG